MTYRELLQQLLVGEGIQNPQELPKDIYEEALYEVGAFFEQGGEAQQFPDAEVPVEEEEIDGIALEERFSAWWIDRGGVE